ncbi:MAG: carbohydrate ABC transporter permease [Devosia sp.]|jgi:ABC-type sugar transport system permease subunit|nr:sugar ABC transporter permease [Devosiaceae bacterium]
MAVGRRNRFAYTLVLPSVLLVACLNLLPLAQGVITSLQAQNMTRPDPNAFVGLKHYVDALLYQTDFWSSLGKTFVWTFGSVIGAYVLSLGLATLLNLDIRFRNFFRAIFLIPWVVPDVVTALIWRWLYNDDYGVFNFVLHLMHLPSVHWLPDPRLAMMSVIIAQIWKLYPLMTVVLLAALQNVPKELHEAASLDGAGAWQRFWYVTLPNIRTASIAITLLTGIWTFQNFDLVYLLTGGGPADATEILPTFIYQKAFYTLDLGYASALGILMLLIILACSSIYLFVSRPNSQPA